MDKYVRLKKIGEGAFGRAVLVRNKHDASQYVVKEINIIKMSPKEREDARKEVAVLAQLKHPNIVAYRDSFEESGSLYIVMDYCSGGDLYGRINTQKGQLFSEDQILDWFVQMCLAIKHIHDRKILHRDIKSQNIFLTSQETVKLGDFGIAKVLGSTVELARTCIGTPYYLSPEICENKPYNNKSDVWSLGCVLYELTTLKHAFEAGNMKNLVLKIIRGSYPPVSSKYSYELRGLIAQLFKRAPRERPSINSILKKPFVSQKVPKFLSNEQLADEFSHTVMHGKKLARKLPPPPQPAASRPSSAVGQRPSSARKYDPAKVYGAPLSKSKENRGSTPDLRKRPGSAGGGPQPKRSPSNSSLNKKKQQFIEKEKKRREEELKKEYEKRHKELIEKQKVARINKSREENWRGIVDSLGSDESEKEKKQEVNNDMGEQVRWQPPKPQVQQPPVPFYNHAPDNRPVSDDKGRYEHYHEYLDKLQERKRQEGVPPAQVPAAAYMAAPRPLPQAPQPNPIWRQAPRVPDATPLAIKQAEKDRFLGQQAAERARIVEEFVQRKKEAAHNKHRGHAAIHGTPAPQIPVQNRGPESAAGQQRPPSGISNRNRDEHKGAGKGKRVQPVNEYLEKLRQIRMQNFNERKNVQGQQKEELDAEARRKKAEALRQQSEDWAEQRKNALEQKRKELMERERVMRENREKGVRPEQRPLPKPAPGLPITGVMNAIGVKPKIVQDVTPANRVPGITGAMEAIGAIPRVVVEERVEVPPAEPRPKTPHQQKKESILKKLNQKGPPRAKWGAPAIPEFEPEEKESDRSKWGAGDAFNFGNMALEETASHMEVTSSQDRVVCNPDSSRRQWKSPDSSVISSLQDRPIVEGTVTIASDKSDESVSPPVSAKPNPITPPTIGSTFTIPKSPIQKGTVIIKTTQQTEGKTVSSESSLSSSNASQEAESSAIHEADSAPSCSSSSEKTSDQTFPAKDQIESHIKSEQKYNANIEKKDEVSKPAIPYRPPLPAKPKDKPLNLPTPKLLPKPDKPMEFGKAPVSSASKSQGEGSLFEKVQLEDEEEGQEGKEERENIKITIDDVEEEETSKDEKSKDKQRTGVALGLTSGSFDINNTQMLRTCSEPDLSSLFRTTSEESPQVKRKSLDMSTVQEEDEQYFEELLSSFENALKLDNPEEGADNPKEDKEVEEDDKEQDQEEDEDYEDLLSVRETMKSLLLQDDDDDGKSMKFSLSSSCEDTPDDPIGVDKMKSTEEGKSRTDRKDRDDREGNTEDGDDEEEVEEDEEEEEQEDSVENDEEIDSSHPHRSVSVDNDNPQSPDERAEMLAELFQSDEESDSEFQEGGGENGEDYDLFSRLEESRAFLEKELGCQKFLKVYKTVQALQEDEDENMEDGARIAIEMLGKDKEHLYPKIFQLVMADTAFTEDSTVDIESLAASFSLL